MFEDLKNNPYVRYVGVAVSVIGIAVLAIGGVGILAGILLLFLIGLSIYFGSVRTLAGSALLATLLKSMSGTIKAFVGIWYAGPELNQFFNLVGSTSYAHLILLFFFVSYLVSFGTGCIRLFSFKNVTKIENGQRVNPDSKDSEKKRETVRVYASR